VRLASAHAKSARWRLARGGRTVAHGVAPVRGGRLAVDLAGLAGVRPGTYRLTVTVGAGSRQAVVHQTITMR
jgi:hypothetical protein